MLEHYYWVCHSELAVINSTIVSESINNSVIVNYQVANCSTRITRNASLLASIACLGDGPDVIAPNVTFDCLGLNGDSVLRGSQAGIGIKVIPSGLTVRSCSIVNFTQGIQVDNTSVVLRDVQVLNSTWGVVIENSTASIFGLNVSAVVPLRLRDSLDVVINRSWLPSGVLIENLTQGSSINFTGPVNFTANRTIKDFVRLSSQTAVVNTSMV